MKVKKTEALANCIRKALDDARVERDYWGPLYARVDGKLINVAADPDELELVSLEGDRTDRFPILSTEMVFETDKIATDKYIVNLTDKTVSFFDDPLKRGDIDEALDALENGERQYINSNFIELLRGITREGLNSGDKVEYTDDEGNTFIGTIARFYDEKIVVNGITLEPWEVSEHVVFGLDAELGHVSIEGDLIELGNIKPISKESFVKIEELWA